MRTHPFSVSTDAGDMAKTFGPRHGESTLCCTGMPRHNVSADSTPTITYLLSLMPIPAASRAGLPFIQMLLSASHVSAFSASFLSALRPIFDNKSAGVGASATGQ